MIGISWRPYSSIFYGDKVLFLSLICCVLATGSLNAAGYPDAKALGEQLAALAGQQSKIMRIQSVAKSLEGREAWSVEIGSGSDEERKTRPALLVVAGIEGNDLAGGAAVLAWIERLVEGYPNDAAIKAILNSTTIYVFPRLNPDAAEKFFARPAIEASANTRPNDDDHDGLIDEDGPEDLNGDGRIAWMRVEDPEGEYILDPSEPRLLMKADPAKGEKGAWRYLPEGRDSDGDESWNEDGAGGTNFNRNFPFNYAYFGAQSGPNPVSESETRALADFVVSHPNIAIAFTFGSNDNLVQTPKPAADSEKPAASGGASGFVRRKPATGINEKDSPYYQTLGEAYRTKLGLKKELTGSSEPGSFADWIYFHRGRLSLAARPWSAALALELEKAKPKEADKEKKEEAGEKKKSEGKQEDKRNEEDRAFLAWIEENAPDVFLTWKAFDHPDFPGKRVEIGGFAPFARTHPPEALLRDLIVKDGDYLTTLTMKMPRIGIRKMESKDLGEGVYEIKIQVENTGYLPTALAQGELTREVYPTRLILDLKDEAFLAGARTTALPTIRGSGGMEERRFIVRPPPKEKKIKIKVVSMIGGTVSAELSLEGGR